MLHLFMEYIILDDFFGMKLWNENIFRRVYHHLTNNNYTKNKIPLLHALTMMLTDEQLHYLQTTNFDTSVHAVNTHKLSIALGGNYSPRDTMYFNNMEKHIQEKLEEMGNSLIPTFNKILNTELRLADSNFRAIILRYEGKQAQFGFHYDTEHNDCFRALILYDGKSIIPPFCYRNSCGQLTKLHFNINDGIVFRGTTTYHGIEPSNDPNTKRYVVGFQYIKIDSNPIEQPSLCNQLRGTTMYTIVSLFMPYSLYYVFLGYQKKLIPYKIQLWIDLGSIGVGLLYTRIPNTRNSTLLFYVFCYWMTLDFRMALSIVSYIIMTEMYHKKIEIHV